MSIRWYGQAAFRLQNEGHTVVIDPFGSMEAAAGRGLRFGYPPIAGVEADLVLVTQEHLDHNGVEVVGGAPQVVRSTAGKFASAVGQVVAVAGEHDPAAGTERGPNTIFVFRLGGVACCHFGDFGQRHLREEQAAAIGRPDLLFLPVGGGPTLDGTRAARIAVDLGVRWVVPMHYRTEAINFLEPVDAFLAALPPERIVRLDSPEFDPGDLPALDGPLAVVPVAPRDGGR